MENFKSLPLQQDQIGKYVNEFIESNGMRLDSSSQFLSGAGCRVERFLFGKALTASATVDFICNKDGTTTVHHSLGKNPDLGIELARFVKGKINPNEFESVELTLHYLKEGDVTPLFDALSRDAYDDAEKMFQLDIEQDMPKLLQLRVRSVKHQDCLVVKFHRTTGSLQLQGKPLFVYKRMCYHFVDVLDILGIEKVLSRTDDSRAQVLSSDVAEHMLRIDFPKTFEKAPGELKKLILSGMCVSLASPSLPDYSMLLYPDLRALEGALHDCFKAYGLYSSNFTDDNEHRIGVMYRKQADNTYTLKQEHADIVTCADMRKALIDGYNQYAGKRHPLFHLGEELLFDTFISDLGVAITLISDTRKCIEELYTHRP